MILEMNYEKGLIASFGNYSENFLTEKVLKAGFQALNLDYIYHKAAIKKEQLAEAVAGARLFGMHGFDLAEELQEMVLPYLDDLSPMARITGRANVVVNREGELIGENSDAKGLVTALLARDILPKGHSFAVVGEENALFIAMAELAISGADTIYLCNDQEEKSKQWMERLKGECDTEFIYCDKIPEDIHVIVGFGLSQDVIDQYEYGKNLRAICDLRLELPEHLQGEKTKKKKIHNEILYYIEEKEILFYKIRLHFSMWTEQFGAMDVMMEAMEEGLLQMAGQENEGDNSFMMEIPELSYVQKRICQYAMEHCGEAVKNYCKMVHGNIGESMGRQDICFQIEEEEKNILAITASFFPLLKFKYEISEKENCFDEEELVEMTCDILEDPEFMGDLTDRVLYLMIHFLKKEEEDASLLLLRQIVDLSL